MAKKTSRTTMNDLFDSFVDALRSRLEEGEATAADLNVVRQFLKDNGIDFIGEVQGGSEAEQQTLADLLPFRADEADAA